MSPGSLKSLINDSNIFSIYSNAFKAFLNNFYLIAVFLVEKLLKSGLQLLIIFIFLNLSAFSTINSFFPDGFSISLDIFNSEFLVLLIDLILLNIKYVFILIFFYLLGKAFINSIIKSAAIGTYFDYFKSGKKIKFSSILKHTGQNFFKTLGFETFKYVLLFLIGVILFIPSVLFIPESVDSLSSLLSFSLFLIFFVAGLILFLIFYAFIMFFFETGPFFIVIEKKSITDAIKESFKFPFKFPVSFTFTEILFAFLSLLTSVLSLTGFLSIIGSLIDIILLKPLFYGILARLFLNKYK